MIENVDLDLDTILSQRVQIIMNIDILPQFQFSTLFSFVGTLFDERLLAFFYSLLPLFKYYIAVHDVNDRKHIIT